MMSIPLIGILLIFVIIIMFVFVKNKDDLNEMEENVFVLFNNCYFIEPHVLVNILEKLQDGVEDEIDIEVYVKVNHDRETRISIEKYFSLYEYKCSVIESCDLNDDSMKFKLKFLKVDK